MMEHDKTLEELFDDLAAKHREIADLFGEMVDRVALHNQRVMQAIGSTQAMYIETPLATCERFAAEHNLRFSMEAMIGRTPAVAFFKDGGALLWKSEHFEFDYRLRRPHGCWLAPGDDYMAAWRRPRMGLSFAVEELAAWVRRVESQGRPFVAIEEAEGLSPTSASWVLRLPERGQ